MHQQRSFDGSNRLYPVQSRPRKTAMEPQSTSGPEPINVLAHFRWLDVVSTPVLQAWRMSLIEDADPGAAQLVEASTTALWFRIGSYRSSRNVVQGFFDYGSGVRPLALGQGEGARYEREGYIDGRHRAYFAVLLPALLSSHFTQWAASHYSRQFFWLPMAFWEPIGLVR